METERKQKTMIGTIISLAVVLAGSLGINLGGFVDANGKVDIIKGVTAEIREDVISELRAENKKELESIIEESLKKQLPILLKDTISDVKDTNERVENMEQREIDTISRKAVGAYSKIFTTEDLKNNPTNSDNIFMGLQLESCKALLMTIDRDRTILFYDYLIGQTPNE